jgi:hypothetical protein
MLGLESMFSLSLGQGILGMTKLILCEDRVVWASERQPRSLEVRHRRSEGKYQVHGDGVEWFF